MTEFTPGNVKAAMSKAGASSGDLWKVPRDQIQRVPGFNVRTHNATYAASVREYADSMKANGYLVTKPMAGYVGESNVILLTDGYTRMDAVDLAVSEGWQCEYLPVIVSPKGTSTEDLNVALVVGNAGKPLTPYEQSVVCKRLVGCGLDSKQIADRLGYASAQYVDNLLMLQSAPLPVRRMVEEGVVSPTEAIKVLSKHGSGAHAVLTKALAGSSKGRITAASTADPKLKLYRKHAGEMRDTLALIKKDKCFNLLSPDVMAAIETLLALKVKRS